MGAHKKGEWRRSLLWYAGIVGLFIGVSYLAPMCQSEHKSVTPPPEFQAPVGGRAVEVPPWN